MTIGQRKVLATILDRISEPGDMLGATFLADEVEGWPPDAVRALASSRLVKETVPADALICLGCEDHCHRPVALLDVADGRASRLVSTCHLKAGMGPFEHSADLLKRWFSSREYVTNFVGRCVGLQVKDHDARWRRVLFDALRIGGFRRGMSLEFDKVAILRIGSSAVPLIELLEWAETGITVSRDALTFCATQSDDGQSGNKRVQPSTTLRDDNKLSTALKTRRLQRRLEILAGQYPNLNKDQLAKKLVQSRDGEGMTAARIARVTHMPKKSRRKRFA